MSAPAGWTPEQVAEASTREIAAGRLPLRAQWRIAEQRERRDAGEPGAFTSNLSTKEFAAIRSVGFSPVGQVMGSAVYNMGFNYGGCGYAGTTMGPYVFNSGGFSGMGMGSRSAQAPVVDVPAVRGLLEQARHRAIERMRAECQGLGGDGVVGVRLTVRKFYGNGLEFLAMGTAVCADGPERPKKPFTSDLSGQDFAALLRAGWVPVDLVLGVGAVIRHDDFAQAMQAGSWSNVELSGMTSLVNGARSRAREVLARDAHARGAAGVVLQEMQLNVFESRCAYGNDSSDHLADAFLWGTGIVPIEKSSKSRSDAPPLQMLRLDSNRRGPR